MYWFPCFQIMKWRSNTRQKTGSIITFLDTYSVGRSFVFTPGIFWIPRQDTSQNDLYIVFYSCVCFFSSTFSFFPACGAILNINFVKSSTHLSFFHFISLSSISKLNQLGVYLSVTLGLPLVVMICVLIILSQMWNMLHNSTKSICNFSYDNLH